MDIFSEKRFLIRIIIVLVIINAGLIGFFIWKEVRCPVPPPPQGQHDSAPKDVSGILMDKLGLTKEQAEKIKQLRSDYFQKENELETVIRDGRDSMNSAMFNKNVDAEKVKQIARRVSDNEYQMELLRIQQAQDLRSICTPEQLDKFEHLVNDIRDYFRPDDPPRKND